MVLNVLSIPIGIGVVVLTLNDVFQSVVVPRATGRRFRISFYVWRVDVAALADGSRGASMRSTPTAAKSSLAIFAPVMLIVLRRDLGARC